MVESNLGFSHIISKYGDNKVITNYFAYNFLSEIFYCSYQLRLEDLLTKLD